MAMRQQSAMRVDRQFAAQLDAPAFDKAPAFALRTKAQVLELDDHDRRETIVKFRDVDVLRRQSGHRKGALARNLSPLTS